MHGAMLEDKKTLRQYSHSITIDNREHATVTGVEDVESFNETEVVLATSSGMMTIVGQGLHISKLNLEEGQLVVEGFVLAMEYAEVAEARKGGLFGRFFR